MNYEDARDALVSRLNTAWGAAYPSIPVFYENTGAIDKDKMSGSFLRAEVKFAKASQASIGASPISRVVGNMFLEVWTKEGQGTRTGLTHVTALDAMFRHQNFSGVQVGTPTPGFSEVRKGWHIQQVAIPFWFHIMA